MLAALRLLSVSRSDWREFERERPGLVLSKIVGIKLAFVMYALCVALLGSMCVLSHSILTVCLCCRYSLDVLFAPERPELQREDDMVTWLVNATEVEFQENLFPFPFSTDQSIKMKE